mgnify:CR=1 FL=1
MLGHMGSDGRVRILPMGRQWPTERSAERGMVRRTTPLLGDGQPNNRRRKPPQIFAGLADLKDLPDDKAKAKKDPPKPKAKAKAKKPSKPWPMWVKFTLGTVATLVPIGIAAYFDTRSGRGSSDDRDNPHPQPIQGGAVAAATASEGPTFVRVKGDTIEAVYTKG